VAAILFSTIVGFLCVIAAAVSPDTVFLFLLNSSGAIILFIYLLIAISQVVLRRRTPKDQLVVKMWLFPVLSIVVILGIAAILTSMLIDPKSRTQILLSTLSVAIVLAIYFATKRIRTRPQTEPAVPAPGQDARRVLVLANETVEGAELLSELHRIDQSGKATYFICVPANPIDTGQAMHAGAVYLWEATAEAAQKRLDRSLAVLGENNLNASGELGDYRPLRALAHSVDQFKPDQLVICTHPEDRSAWLRYEIVERARESYPNLPVSHVIVEAAGVTV
jgi:GABA permease